MIRAAAVERRFPFVEIGLDKATQLLRSVSVTARSHELLPLTGGHINTNYLAKLADGRSVVLRIYCQGEAAFRKELDVLKAVAGSVPVPHLYGSGCDANVLAYPYAVFEWIDGVSLNAVLSRGSDDAASAGKEIAEIVLSIRRHSFPSYPFPSFAQYIHHCLFERRAADHLGSNTTSLLWSLAQREGAFLDSLTGEGRLVHGDFQGENILLREDGNRWRVAVVLDWEWAHNGCYLQDIGALLRFEGEATAAFQMGIEAGFAEHKAPLPRRWVSAARIWDVAAQCEKLTFPRHRGEVTKRAIRMVERCVRDFAH